MLQTSAKFPNPGSVASYDGLRFTILRHHHDGTALIAEKGVGRASAQRTVPLADLIDPREQQANDRMSFQDEEQATAKIALYVSKHLRDRNEIPLRELGVFLTAKARDGRVPLHKDNSHLVRIMRKLGWQKVGYFGEGYERSPLYRRNGEAGPNA